MQANSANRINFSDTFPVGVTNRINRLPALTAKIGRTVYCTL